jgi:Reverse transcriptase (RNA-dependent DNA polymerase)
MVKKRVPRRLWDYGIVWVCEVMSLTANSNFALEGRTPLEQLTGETPDISEYLDFGFYDYVWYRDNAGVGDNKFGRWLGVSHRIGILMSFWILTEAGNVISRTTVQRVTNLELTTVEVRQRAKEYDEHIKELLKDNDLVVPDDDERVLQDWNDYTDLDDEDCAREFSEVISDEKIPEADEDFTPDTIGDTYMEKEVIIPDEADAANIGRVTKRLRDAEGRPIGVANENPLLDTREYAVEFRDGRVESLSANMIAKNLYSQLDEEGKRHLLLADIVDHRRDERAIDKADAFIKRRNGVKRRLETTQGWQLLCEWKDGSTNWVALKDARHSYPVLVAEYAVANRIDDEPAFAWWVHDVIKKRDRIIAKVKSKYWQQTHEYGIKIPKSVQEAIAIDKENGNTLWWDAICKEMKNVMPAFEKWEGKEGELPPGFQRIKCHFIFDIKMGENFRRKARLVANGNETETPAALTYSSVVSRDSIRIALLVASLNQLDVLACDIQNAYSMADCREKIYIIAGPEFGSLEGCIMIIRKALYGLKSSGAAFRAHLAETLYDLN